MHPVGLKPMTFTLQPIIMGDVSANWAMWVYEFCLPIKKPFSFGLCFDDICSRAYIW